MPDKKMKNELTDLIVESGTTDALDLLITYLAKNDFSMAMREANYSSVTGNSYSIFEVLYILWYFDNKGGRKGIAKIPDFFEALSKI